MTFFMSMLSSIAADQLGIRKVGCIGATLAFAGLLTSSFVKVSGKMVRGSAGRLSVDQRKSGVIL